MPLKQTLKNFIKAQSKQTPRSSSPNKVLVRTISNGATKIKTISKLSF